MSTRWELGPYTVERDPDCLFLGLESIKLPKRHLDTLLVLLEAGGEVVAKEQFFERVWSGLHVEEGNLTQTIFLLRKTLGRLPNGGEYIETMPRRGYRLVPGISRRVEAPEGTLPPCMQDDARKELPAEAAGDRDPQGEARAGSRRRRWPVWAAAAVLLLAGALGWLRWKVYERPRLTGTVRLTNDGGYKEVLAPLLTAGRRLYFTEIVNNENRLTEVSVLGGFSAQRRAPTPGHTALAVSRWHEGVLFGTTWEGENSVNSEVEEPMLLQAEDGAVRHLGQVAGHGAAWSPDGERLAFTSGHDVLLSDGNGEAIRPLSHLAGVPYWPAWSPDGRKVRFSVQDDTAGSSLVEMDADGGVPRAVLARSANAGRACCGQWSPDGRWFAYVVNSPNRSGVWLRREAQTLGSREFEIASGPMDYWRSPVFSEDGHALYAVGEQARGEMMRYDEGRQQWWPALSGLSADTLQFSPDRRWMAYTLYPEGTVWRSRADGSDRMQLSAAGETGRFPHWSPDGQRIAYIAGRPGQPWRVEEVDTAGNHAPRTVLRESGSQGAATYSPDGEHVAFGRIMAYGMAAGEGQGISVVDLRSGQVEKVPGSDGLWIVRWSPDGRWLAAMTANRKRLMLFDWTKGEWTRLPTQGVNDLVWSHDGRSLYFDSTNGKDAAVFRVEMTDRTVHRHADLSGLQRTGFAGWRLSLDAEDRLLVLRQAGTVEVYRLDLELPD